MEPDRGGDYLYPAYPSILMIMINSMVSKKIVKGITNIASVLTEIANGNLDAKIQENDNPEFQILSQHGCKYKRYIRQKQPADFRTKGRNAAK